MSPRIRYVIQAIHPAAHRFLVRMTVSEPHGDEQRFSLPAWIPGSYLLREFSKNLGTIRAEAQGNDVPVHKIDRNTWAIRDVSGPVELQYEVYAWDLSVRSAHLDQTHGYFNGTSLCLMAHGFENESHQVDLLAPEDPQCAGWQVATTLPRTQGDPWGFGSFIAHDYDELVDHPVEMGTFTVHTFEPNGVPHHLAITGHHRGDIDRLCTDAKAICETHISMFGELPDMPSYLFQLTVVGNGYGGLEHRSSTSLMAKRDDLPPADLEEVTEDYTRLLGLFSHEYFHTWNVKRIKPALFVPFDLSKEAHTTLLWAFEGITSYYDDLGLVRSGSIPAKNYLELVGMTATRVYRGRGRFKQSLLDSSFDTWTKFYRQDENAPNAIVSYYGKGSLVALALDLNMRLLSNGEKCLDDVMRALWQHFGKPGVGVPEDAVEKVAQEILGHDLRPFFDQALRGTDDLPLAELLKEFGVLFQMRPQEGPKDKGGKAAKKSLDALLKSPNLGAKIEGTPQGAKLVQVFDGSSAQDAGLSAHDVVVALDGLKVKGEGLENRIAAQQPGDTLQVHAFRRDELMEFELKLKAPESTTVYLEFDPEADEAVVERRRAWLHLPDEA